MDINFFITFFICCVVIFFIGKTFAIPMKKIIKLIGNSIMGGALIYIINIIGENINLHIGLNIGTSIFVGILGIPGTICLIILKFFL